MKKNMSFFAGAFLFVLTAIIILCVTPKDIKPVIYVLWGFNAIGAMLLGQYYYAEKPNYNWSNLKEGKSFEILSIGMDFQNPTIEKKYAPIVVNLEDFGHTIIMFPTEKSYWGYHSPKKGEKFFKNENCIHLFNK